MTLLPLPSDPQANDAQRFACFVQSDVADGVIELLAGAMKELNVGDPHKLSTDVGPVIDQAAHDRISAHLMHLKETATFIAKSPSADPKTKWLLRGTASLGDFELVSLARGGLRPNSAHSEISLGRAGHDHQGHPQLQVRTDNGHTQSTERCT